MGSVIKKRRKRMANCCARRFTSVATRSEQRVRVRTRARPGPAAFADGAFVVH